MRLLILLILIILYALEISMLTLIVVDFGAVSVNFVLLITLGL